MPRRKQSAKVDHVVVAKKIYVVYSTKRTYCFAEEIRAGFFGPCHRCGCVACDPLLVLPEPPFMPRQNEQGAWETKG